MILQELKPLFVGVALVFGVMLAGPLTSQAGTISSNDGSFVAASAANGGRFATARMPLAAKPQGVVVGWFGSAIDAPRYETKRFDVSKASAAQFGDAEDDADE